MSTPTPSIIPGVDRDALAEAIHGNTVASIWAAGHAADVALAYIAAHHECACDREHADEWVQVDEATWRDLPDGVRLRQEWAKDRRLLQEWVRGDTTTPSHYFVRRDDLPDPDPRALIARELGPAKADTFLGLLAEHGWTVTRKGER